MDSYLKVVIVRYDWEVPKGYYFVPGLPRVLSWFESMTPHVPAQPFKMYKEGRIIIKIIIIIIIFVYFISKDIYKKEN